MPTTTTGTSQAGQSWFTHGRAVLGGWLRYHWEIFHFHSGLNAAHPYLSRPYGWLLLARPVDYFYASPDTCGATTCSQAVLAIGTPLLWWMVIPALVAVLWRAVGRFDWRAMAILVSFLVGFLPWIYEDLRHHRTMFLFYLMPALPFMVLAVTMGVGMVIGRRSASYRRRVAGIAVAAVYTLSVVGTFAYFYPVLSGQTITYDQWRHRMWLDHCDGGEAPQRAPRARPVLDLTGRALDLTGAVRRARSRQVVAGLTTAATGSGARTRANARAAPRWASQARTSRTAAASPSNQ